MVAADDGTWALDFPTLFIVPDWVAQHCRIRSVGGLDNTPQPFEMYDWQLRCTANFYRVKPTAQLGQLSTAFHYRRGQVVAPQKSGKGPWTAGIVAAEAVGPVLFAGWAKGGERFEVLRVAERGCVGSAPAAQRLEAAFLLAEAATRLIELVLVLLRPRQPLGDARQLCPVPVRCHRSNVGGIRRWLCLERCPL